MKKLLALMLATVMLACSFVGCSDTDDAKLKIGVILIGDEQEGYTFAHIDGIEKAVEELGYTDKDVKIIYKYKVKEDDKCYDAAVDLVEQGCKLVISNSYGHESYIKQAAEQYPDVDFVAMTGDTAKTSGLSNMHNAFTKVYESRYVSGVVAGMKVKELVDTNQLSDKNYDENGKVRIGYVGAFPFAEVVSGYTAFFLGIQSVYPDVVMDVNFTNSWFSPTDEAAAAKALASKGCVIIGQHADSTGAPSAVEELHDQGEVIYCVGYNIDMRQAAPDSALVSATNNWSAFYKTAIQAAFEGKEIPTNWSQGYQQNAVAVTEFGTCVAAGTAEKVAEVEAELKNGTLNIFDTKKFTVNGETITEYLADLDGDFTGDTNVIDENGIFQESDAENFRSAPYFAVLIDGITQNLKTEE